MIEEVTTHENYLSAEETVKFGLTDKVIRGEELLNV